MNLRKISILLAVIIMTVCIIGLVSCGGAASNKSSKFSVGENIAAKYYDDEVYLAVIKVVNKKGTYDILYPADNIEQPGIKEENLYKLSDTLALAVGDNVIAAIPNSSKFAKGVVQEVKSGSALIKWNDGSEPAEVVLNKIIKQ